MGFFFVQIINVTNHTYGKVTIQWNCGNDRTFSIMPSTMDIPPLKSCAFQVTFKPVSVKYDFGASSTHLFSGSFFFLTYH